MLTKAGRMLATSLALGFGQHRAPKPLLNYQAVRVVPELFARFRRSEPQSGAARGQVWSTLREARRCSDMRAPDTQDAPVANACRRTGDSAPGGLAPASASVATGAATRGCAEPLPPWLWGKATPPHRPRHDKRESAPRAHTQTTSARANPTKLEGPLNCAHTHTHTHNGALACLHNSAPATVWTLGALPYAHAPVVCARAIV